MSLFKQIMMFITALFFLVLIIVFSIHFSASREFVEKDLYQRAKNAVNSLSLSLGDVSEDVTLMETTINAMFDGGHFRKIVLKDTEKNILYETEEAILIDGVPRLFIQFLNLRAPTAEVVVSNGWKLVGSLQVQAHTGGAVIRMWRIFKELCFYFCLIWVGSLIVSGVLLKRMLLSLDLIRAQAEAIEENRFVINSHTPFTSEFKKVVEQMNKMVTTVKNNYDRSLRTIKEAKRLRFCDPMTGLYNRTYFVTRIEAYMNTPEAFSRGEAALVAVDGLPEFKDTAGWEITEDFMKAVAASLKRAVDNFDGQVVARINQAEFGLILPGIDGKEAVKIIGTALEMIFKRIDADPQTAGRLGVFAGLAAYQYDEGASRVFSKLDYAVTQAKNNAHPHPWHFREERDYLLERQEWKTLIRNALDHREFVFLCQPVLGSDNSLYHKEVFIAIDDGGESLKRAGFFMATATQLNLAQQIDRHVIERVTGEIENGTDVKTPFAINISTDFIGKRSSMVWVGQYLSDNRHLSDRLFFEISEAALVRFPEICLDFAGVLSNMGFKLGIDNFTLGDDSLSLLRQIIPAYIKSDANYLYDARDESQSKITLGMLQTIIESLDAKLIATKIETSYQLDALKSEGIGYFQGEYVGAIQGLEPYDD